MHPDGYKQTHGCLHLCIGYHAKKLPYHSANSMANKAKNKISTLDPKSLDYDIVTTALHFGRNIDILAIQVLGLPFESMNNDRVIVLSGSLEAVDITIFSHATNPDGKNYAGNDLVLFFENCHYTLVNKDKQYTDNILCVIEEQEKNNKVRYIKFGNSGSHDEDIRNSEALTNLVNAHASSLKKAETEVELIVSKITSVKESQEDVAKNDAVVCSVSTSRKESVTLLSKDINIKVTS
jgi:hypothetical protein